VPYIKCDLEHIDVSDSENIHEDSIGAPMWMEVLQEPFLLRYVPQHRTFKLQDTRQDREQHHDTSIQTRIIERHHGKNMAPVAPPTIERRRQLIVTATRHIIRCKMRFTEEKFNWRFLFNLTAVAAW
ncbi:hypothetical protein AVEN_66583-1, partial [Araneus ventricosus]